MTQRADAQADGAAVDAQAHDPAPAPTTPQEPSTAQAPTAAEPAAGASAPSIRLRLDLAYDGTAFSGWAKQPGLRTVQGVLEGALATVFRRHEPAPTLTVAGRTDAGVHATGQVAHVDLTAEQVESLASHRGGHAEHPAPEMLMRRINGISGLSSDVFVSRISIAPPGFDARFSAVWRRYEYRVADAASVHHPLQRAQTLWYPAELDTEAMDAAAHALLGLHDWAAYCKPREGASTIRTLQDFGWTRDHDGVLIARPKADAFCHSMVRALVGGCIAVGEGKLSAVRLVELRNELARTSEFIVAPAKGLTLVEVGYPPDDELSARAEQTRARREPVTAVSAEPSV